VFCCIYIYIYTRVRVVLVALKMSTNTGGKRSKSQGATPLILSPADIEGKPKEIIYYTDGEVRVRTYC